jgi:hypothetical protein
MTRIIVPIVNRLTEPAITIVDGRKNLLTPSWAGTVLSAPIAPVAGCGRVTVIAKIREESGESPIDYNYGNIEAVMSMPPYPYVSGFFPGDPNVRMGTLDGFWYTWHRYQNLSIPAGATITSCYLNIVATYSESYYENHLIRVNISFQDADAAINPVSGESFFSMPRTDPVAWENLPEWVPGTTYQSPDLSESLQQVIDRAGYEQGNPIMVIIDDNGSGTVELREGNQDTMQLVVGWS